MSAPKYKCNVRVLSLSSPWLLRAWPEIILVFTLLWCKRATFKWADLNVECWREDKNPMDCIQNMNLELVIPDGWVWESSVKFQFASHFFQVSYSLESKWWVKTLTCYGGVSVFHANWMWQSAKDLTNHRFSPNDSQQPPNTTHHHSHHQNENPPLDARGWLEVVNQLLGLFDWGLNKSGP